MAVDQRVSKYVHISDFIKKELSRGRWKAGDKLPPARHFVEQFDVTPVTVWKALDVLGQEGLIHRVQGKGTFVTESRSALKTQLIGVSTRTRGDSYGITFDALAQQLKAHHYSPLILDMEDEPNRLHADWQQHLTAILENDLQALILDGASFQPFNYLQQHEDQLPPITFMRVFETDLQFKRANVITCDWEAGGYLAAKHLLDQGYEKLTYLTFGDPAHAPMSMGPDWYYNQSVKHGIERAIHETGQDEKSDLCVVLDIVDQEPTPKLRNALKQGYTGVICLGDVRALKVYRLAAKMKKTIGKDIGVCGYFNTQWASLLNTALTSVQVHEETIGQLAAQSVIEGWKGVHRTVQPQLVIKESSQCA